MSREPAEYRPLADLMNDLKLAIENGTFKLAKLENTNTKHINAEENKAAGLKPKQIKELAMHALEKDKMSAFDLIVQNQFQKTAEDLQVEKLKKEIDKGKVPDLKKDPLYLNLNQKFSCKASEEVIEEKTGYMSSSQDYGDKSVRTEVVDSFFYLSDKNKVELVGHALSKPEIAKKLVVQLSPDDLQKFTNHSVLGESVKEESETRQKEASKQKMLGQLDTLETSLKELKKHYENKSTGYFFADVYKSKSAEAQNMRNEITALKTALNSNVASTSTWTFNKDNPALKDGKQLMASAKNLEQLQKNVKAFIPQSTATSTHTK